MLNMFHFQENTIIKKFADPLLEDTQFFLIKEKMQGFVVWLG